MKDVIGVLGITAAEDKVVGRGGLKQLGTMYQEWSVWTGGLDEQEAAADQN